MSDSRKTALITGATRGLGWEFAEIFASRGFDLFLTGRDEARLRELKQKLDTTVDVTTIVADLSAPGGAAKVLAAVKKSGAAIDILVNNAGLGDRTAFADSKLEKQQGMVQVNIASLVSLTHGLLPGMVSRRSGRVLNVASTAGFVPGPNMAIYYASKAFVISFSWAIAFELRGSGVTVSVLCPGATRTDFDKTAGTSRSRLVKTGVMEARPVAEAGVKGLFSGKRMIVPGFANKLAAGSSRIAPRGMASRLASTLNSDG